MPVIDSYVRGSATDARATSISGRHEMNMRLVREMGAEPGFMLDDSGRSAWDAAAVRPGWDAVARRLESGASDGVMIYAMGRLVHPFEDAQRIVALAKSGHALIDSAAEFDPSTTRGRKALLDAARAERDYRQRLSTHVRRGNRLKAVRGEGRRGRYRPIGFEDDGTTVRESERPYLAEAAERILAGARWQDVADYLNAKGFHSTAQVHTRECRDRRASLTGIQYRQYQCECPHRQWTVEALRSALTAPRMAGYVKLGNELILGRLPGTPVVEPAKWHRLKTLVQSRRGRPPMDDYLCTGKDSPVRCGNCGSYLTVNSGGRGAAYSEDGELRRYYRCVKAGGGCGRTIADWRALDKAITAMTVDRLSDPAHIDRIRQAQEAVRLQRTPHEQKIAELERLQDHWDDRLNTGKITREKHTEMSDDLLRQIREERDQLSRLDAAGAPPFLDNETLLDMARVWRAAPVSEKRTLLRQAYRGLHIIVRPGPSTEDDVRHRITAAPATLP